MNLRFYDPDQISQPNLVILNVIHMQIHFAMEGSLKSALYA